MRTTVLTAEYPAPRLHLPHPSPPHRAIQGERSAIAAAIDPQRMEEMTHSSDGEGPSSSNPTGLNLRWATLASWTPLVL